MNTNNDVVAVVDVNGSPVLGWGVNDQETVRFNQDVLTEIQTVSQAARVATDYATDMAAYKSALRGQATMLGLAISSEVDIFAPLRSFLLASRDHEGELGEVFARKRDLDTSRCHSARRGWLDSTAYEMDRAMTSLEALRVYEAGRAAR